MTGLASHPPPGPFRREFWRSPLRGPWLTSMLGLALLVGIPVVFATGLLSHAAYVPDLGENRLTGERSVFDFWVFDWTTRPAWIYVATQGLHVTVGLAVIPIVLAKLWSVIPRLFEWPPVAGAGHGLERLSLALLVGGSLFELVTGMINVQVYYPWRFDFIVAHYYGAWVFMAAFVLHVGLKLGTVRRSLRERGVVAELRRGLDATEPERAGAGGAALDDVLVPAAPDPPTISRRGLLAAVGGASAGLVVMFGGQVVGGPLRRLSVLAPHGPSRGTGPNDFQVNKTAASVGVRPSQTGADWRLELVGPRPARLSRPQLLLAPQQTYDLPIACVEGWSTTQRWTGVRLSELAGMAGVPDADEVLVESLQRPGRFSHVTLSREQIADPRSLLALKVNGADLSLDHGFPARIIVPAAPGVHCTKWVGRMTFRRTV